MHAADASSLPLDRRARTVQWVDRTAEGRTLGLDRVNAIVHNGWQIGYGGYAANESQRIPAAEPPHHFMQLFSTSVGVLAMCSAGGTMTLYRSPDGLAPYEPLAAMPAGRMFGCLPLLVDCGFHRLLIFEYCTDAPSQADNTSRIWATTDGGQTWRVLLTTAPGAIRHFHGGTYDAATGRLFAFTGDLGAAASICHCADVDDLIGCPERWRTRWGLADAGRSTLDPAYVAGWGSQAYRVIGTAFQGRYMYFGADAYAAEGVPISRLHRTTLTIDKVPVLPHSPAAQNGNAVSEIWTWGTANDGSILATNQAQPYANGYYGDEFLHVYRLDPDGATMREIYRIPRNGKPGVVLASIHAVGELTVLSAYSCAWTMKPEATRIGSVREVPA